MMNAYTLSVNFNFNGIEQTIYPVVIKTEHDLMLVDCGYEGFMPLLESAAYHHGIFLSDLTGIIVTHHDVDHIGGLAEIKEKYSHLKVYSSEIERDYINGKEKSLRLLQAESVFPFLPEEQKQGALHFMELLSAIKPVPIDFTFSEDEAPNFLGSVKIINTPGHMPGHISLYLQESKILIAADALVFEEDRFEIANPHFTLDLPQAIQSIKKLRDLEIEKIICYHGGIVDANIPDRLDELLRRYE